MCVIELCLCWCKYMYQRYESTNGQHMGLRCVDWKETTSMLIFHFGKDVMKYQSVGNKVLGNYRPPVGLIF